MLVTITRWVGNAALYIAIVAALAAIVFGLTPLTLRHDGPLLAVGFMISAALSLLLLPRPRPSR